MEPTQGPSRSDRTVAEWHTPPPPDPIVARRIRNLRWERAAVVAGLVAFVPLYFLGAKHHFALQLGALLNPYFLLMAWVWTRRPPVSVKHLMDLPPIPGQFPVQVNYVADKFQYGADDGVVTIEGSWITFQGLRSNFAVQRHQADVVAFSQGKRSRSADLLLQIQESGKLYAIGFRPYDQIDGVGQGYKKRFAAAAENWKNLTEKTVGEPTLPPLTPPPGSRERARRNGVLSLVLPAFPMGFFVFMIATNRLPAHWPYVLFACAGASWLLSLITRYTLGRAAFLRTLANPAENPVPQKSALPVAEQPGFTPFRLDSRTETEEVTKQARN